ncbi:TetM/TetW/TetO/TetS family tetracycline resistance ribosomal protection protein [Ktedonosporobacter rubrisoli]|uniref:TetM/TetW/TetO/TetS family tetracycline resistance ribosomal protection protein n=1 Tax=Ktedonosporobacter rubrisoli TaxID=2509675 RepID=A0A4P6JV76_KTERU|nr:TetM/TetW/TetO/TetS family tetracycline resistance ribosomal protection protein [Ktedonosporobacter rubrisoli]QBD79263.1 TetM/TetW/TetO/TetS family tetracycline resistance ribosomal protection protein [Ktedonosporobacter rubrisoli]
MTTINIGIVAHVDAGKTTLTERILYETHVIAEIGRVDQGTTQTDSLDLEKRRGITIKASVVSFFVNTLKINLIDTPGHADFLAEVERALCVLDGAILLISAVEGIQAQTSILLSALRKLHIPTIIFINKIDRSGAQSDALLKRIKEKLTEHIIPLNMVEHIGTKQACVVPHDLQDPDFLQGCIEQLTLYDEQLLAAYVEDGAITEEWVRTTLMQQARQARFYPVMFGSAFTGVGVKELLDALGSYFPSNTGLREAPLSGVVFKLEKEPMGEKIAYVRVFAGSMCVRADIHLQRYKPDGENETFTGKIQKLHLFWEGKTVQTQTVAAGEFCKVWGWKDAKIGDVVGSWSEHLKTLHFATPRYETRIEAVHSEQGFQLSQALLELAEEDPLISVLKDNVHQSIYLRIFGEVQKEVVEMTLKESYGLEVRFSKTSVVCIEKPVGTGHALAVLGAEDNPFIATVGFLVEPGPLGSGLTYRSVPGALPLSYYRAIEETLRATLTQGLYGWEVTDIVVTLTHRGFDRQAGSTASEFRNLVPLILMEALSQAGTAVYEPINQFELSVPVQAISTALFKLSLLGAAYEQPTLRHDTFFVTGTLPVITSETFRRELASFTGGEGVFLTQEAGFRKIEGAYPTRKRMDYNPLNRQEYLLHIHHLC